MGAGLMVFPYGIIQSIRKLGSTAAAAAAFVLAEAAGFMVLCYGTS